MRGRKTDLSPATTPVIPACRKTTLSGEKCNLLLTNPHNKKASAVKQTGTGSAYPPVWETCVDTPGPFTLTSMNTLLLQEHAPFLITWVKLWDGVTSTHIYVHNTCNAPVREGKHRECTFFKIISQNISSGTSVQPELGVREWMELYNCSPQWPSWCDPFYLVRFT